jgi:hypothetical protein
MITLLYYHCFFTFVTAPLEIEWQYPVEWWMMEMVEYFSARYKFSSFGKKQSSFSRRSVLMKNEDSFTIKSKNLK